MDLAAGSCDRNRSKLGFLDGAEVREEEKADQQYGPAS